MKVVVNGGTSGIGLELVRIFSSDAGSMVVSTGRTSVASRGLSGSNLLHLQADLLSLDDTGSDLAASIKGFLGEVDILINNAGSIINKDFSATTSEEARRLFEVNFIGPATLTRLLRPLMKRGSHIVNISSMGGFQGSKKYSGLSYYSASKAALASLTESLAAEFASEGVRVNCIAPGAVATDMFQAAFPGHKAPVSATDMAMFIADFALNAGKLMSGKIIPASVSDP
jgi:3-oxoacyl-[acyl-carrier protein] reductase